MNLPSFTYERSFSSVRIDKVFSLLLFLFFFTLSADLFHLKVFLFKVKINHLTALLLLTYFTIKNRWVIEKKIFFSSLLLLSSFTVSAFASVYWMRSFAYVFIFFFDLVAYFFLPISLMWSVHRERYLSIYLLSFKCLGVYAVAQFVLYMMGIHDPCVSQTIADKFGRAQGFSYEPSYYALYMTAFVFYYNARVLLEGARLSFKNMAALLGVNLLLLVSTSTGGFFSYLLFWPLMILLSFFSRIKKINPHILSLFGKITLFFVLLFSSIFLINPRLFLESFFKFFTTGFFGHGSFMGRWVGLENAWNLFLEHPWFGVGVGGMGPYLYQQEIYDGRAGDMSGITLEDVELYDPMNTTTELLASLGIFGVCCYAIFGFFYLRVFFLALRQDLSCKEKIVILSLLISVIVLVLSAQFNQGLLRSYVWTHLGIGWGYAFSKLGRKSIIEEQNPIESYE